MSKAKRLDQLKFENNDQDEKTGLNGKHICKKWWPIYL